MLRLGLARPFAAIGEEVDRFARPGRGVGIQRFGALQLAPLQPKRADLFPWLCFVAEPIGQHHAPKGQATGLSRQFVGEVAQRLSLAQAMHRRRYPGLFLKGSRRQRTAILSRYSKEFI